ncbi:hypothetical protein CVT24_008267 [Panaeolus cyanescens]|uniref:BTB domain-containing protein n=1 Tax=Panaeolus cyanescens TaxID=181874 RepID=A0A409W0F4_9AGAR|nr:hypothetical protein CVT24_008267 [Panaeolus cyanescens]
MSLSTLTPASPIQAILVVVEDTRYWLTKNELSKFSEVFHGMFEHAPHLGGSQEGTAQNPIVLHGIKRLEFEPLVRWIRFGVNPPTNRPYTCNELVAMLRIADQWCMQDAKEFCFTGLSVLNPNPFFLLGLFTSYREFNRILPHVKAAVRMPMNDWDFTESSIYIPLLKLKVRIDEVRRIHAAVPDGMFRQQDCTNHITCEVSWRNDWRLTITERVFHPTDPLPLSLCFSAMNALSTQPSTCRQVALLDLRLNDDYMIEDDLYTEAVNSITDGYY